MNETTRETGASGQATGGESFRERCLREYHSETALREAREADERREKAKEFGSRLGTLIATNLGVFPDSVSSDGTSATVAGLTLHLSGRSLLYYPRCARCGREDPLMAQDACTPWDLGQLLAEPERQTVPNCERCTQREQRSTTRFVVLSFPSDLHAQMWMNDRATEGYGIVSFHAHPPVPDGESVNYFTVVMEAGR